MTILASDQIQRAQTIILDDLGVRWELREWLKWLNDGQRETVIHKPSALAVNDALALQAGTLQKVPDKYIGLLKLVRNLSSAVEDVPRVGGRAIRIIDRASQDAQNMDWHNPECLPYDPIVKQYVFDEEDQTSFYTVPGNDGTGVVEAVFIGNPADIDIGAADPDVLASYALPISLPDIYGNALLDYMLFRAYSKDTSIAAALQRAGTHYQLFGNSLGVKLKMDYATSPNNRAGAAQALSG